MLYKNEKGTDAKSESNSYYSSLSELISESGNGKSYEQNGTLTVTNTYYNISINSTNYGEGATVLSNSNYYWVASRCVYAYSNGADFGLRVADSNMYGDYMFYSDCNYSYGSYAYRLRAVVSLGSNVQIEKCTGTNSATNMHKITSYGE
jgi:hypothetical protein